VSLVVFLRGVNVGGHRTFRPSILAKGLSDYGVVNVGAAGTFVVRKPGSKAKFCAALLRKLPFEAEVVICDGRDLIRLEMEKSVSSRAITTRYCSICEHPVESRRPPRSPPSHIPARGGVARASHGLEGAIRLWRVPSPHENHRLSWPD
jgi:hypothetical protein